MHIHALAGVGLLWIVAQIPVDAKFDTLNSGVSLVALSIYIFFSIPAGAIIYAFLVRERFRRILWYTGVVQCVQVTLVLVTMISGYEVETLLVALAAFALLRWLYVLVSGGWFSQGIPALAKSWAFALFALPLILHAFNSGLMDYVDGWIVSLVFGEESFALYRYGARELPFNVLLIGGLVSGLVHRFKATDVVDAATLRAEILQIMKLLFPINCALILLSPVLYTLVYHEEFAFSARIFNIYALTLLSRVVINQVFCYVHHHTWVLTWSTAVEVVVNVILSILLMQWLGLLGIPLATVLAYALQKLFLIIYVRKKFGVRLSEYVPITQGIWYFTAMIACVILAEWIYF
jgi:O-antigen/teichoic acid export membrane protein